jgi:CBS domain-containing protein
MNDAISTLPFVEDVKTMSPSDTVATAISIFKSNKIGSVVIVDRQSQVLGIFTERDLVLKVSGNEDLVLLEPIEKYMTPNPKSVEVTDHIMKAAISMRLGKFRHMIVKNEDGTLRGIISIKDVLDWLLDGYKL